MTVFMSASDPERTFLSISSRMPLIRLNVDGPGHRYRRFQTDDAMLKSHGPRHRGIRQLPECRFGPVK